MGCDCEHLAPLWIPLLGETCHKLVKGRTYLPFFLSPFLFTFIGTFPDCRLPLLGPSSLKLIGKLWVIPPWSATCQACPGFIWNYLLPCEQLRERTISWIFLSMTGQRFCPHQKWWTYFCDTWTHTLPSQSCHLVLHLCLPSSYCDLGFPWGNSSPSFLWLP
jgi:hypothetical protein